LSTSRLHFMGIGGQGISAVAQMSRLKGDIVTGCDRSDSATVQAMRAVGIPVQIGHHADHLDNVDTLVISPAVPALDPHNVELLAARERGLRVVNWQEVLGELMQGKCLLSVCGVHGKGTTTAMLALTLVDAGLDPTCEIGAVVPRFGTNYRLGQSDYFVNEADEFNHNFWHYHPRLVVVTSIEFEHPEFYANYDEYLDAFEHFIRGMDLQGDWPLPPTVILNADSAGCWDLRERLHGWPGQILTYSAGHSARPAVPADLEAYDIKLVGETSFRVKARSGAPFPAELRLQLSLPGLYNVENALAALSVAHLLGVDATSIVHSLEGFAGNRRRFEIRQRGPLTVAGQRIDVMLVDDYAHHPTAIAATLEAARQRYPGRRIVAVYQPHMYSRTKAFFKQFLRAFDAADVAIIADIYPAREHDTGLVHARELVDAIGQRAPFASGKQSVLYGGSVTETTQLLAATLCSGDLAVIMGAGDIYLVTETLLHATTVTDTPTTQI
jgi:UDP-N-acetylmuramate--alanine ligase